MTNERRHPPTNSFAFSAPSHAMDSLIPLKNMPALVSYYFGVFSFIPLIGALLGVPAVILGLMGLSRVSKMPEAKGKVHAWVGLILGLLVGVGQIVLITAFFMMMPRSSD